MKIKLSQSVAHILEGVADELSDSELHRKLLEAQRNIFTPFSKVTVVLSKEDLETLVQGIESEIAEASLHTQRERYTSALEELQSVTP